MNGSIQRERWGIYSSGHYGATALVQTPLLVIVICPIKVMLTAAVQWLLE